MKWQIEIEDPSGETRHLPLQGSVTLGRNESAAIPLRDPTAAPDAALISPMDSAFWIHIPSDAPACTIGDLPVRQAQLPLGVPFRLGETRLTLREYRETLTLPQFPNGVRPWLTASETGKDVLWLTKKAAQTPLSLYIAGETGTGKEVLAHLIHAWSDRAGAPFVPLHCGALALSLAESELFGHVKGAFTGAVVQRPGALMQAHNGTLFLDEIGDLPLDIQVKLLRFLENGEVRPVGADHASRANVRVLCATHHPLQQLVEEGKFRRDLYYRLASITIDIPPLRSRAEDIELLAQQFANDLGRSLSPKVLLRLQAYPWPGNVRELRHAIERASGLAGPFSPLLNEEAFDFLIHAQGAIDDPLFQTGGATLSLTEMERFMLLKALKLAHGNRTKAAKILGVARSTLFEMLKRHRVLGPKSTLAA